MLSSALQSQLAQLSRRGLQQEAPLAPYTTFRIGGPAQYLLVIDELPKLKKALSLLHQAREPFLLLGGGSNVLISDAGIPGLTIINRCKAIHWPELLQSQPPKTALVQVEAGATLAGLARACIGRGLAGLSWAVSIPGSVGGAIVGNAGAHGGDIASVLTEVTLWRAGGVETWPAVRMEFGYRSSRLKTSGETTNTIILSATFSLRPDSSETPDRVAAEALQYRRRTQPAGKSAGSVFKNPPGDYAGRLIEQAGLKGRCIGDACISELHANFIINRGQATAADVLRLMALARNQVQRRFGVLLEPEILLLGDCGSMIDE